MGDQEAEAAIGLVEKKKKNGASRRGLLNIKTDNKITNQIYFTIRYI